MDASRFDSWTRAVGRQSGRRALLRGIAGAAVALGAAGGFAERTKAQKKKCDKKTKKKCGKQGLACEKGKCALPCNARNAQCLGNFAVLLCGDPINHTCACSRLLEGGFTIVERTLIDIGRDQVVRDLRHNFQLAMQDQYTSVVETRLGRRVVAYLSQVHTDPDVAVELFMLEPLERGVIAEHVQEFPDGDERSETVTPAGSSRTRRGV